VLEAPLHVEQGLAVLC